MVSTVLQLFADGSATAAGLGVWVVLMAAVNAIGNVQAVCVKADRPGFENPQAAALTAVSIFVFILTSGYYVKLDSMFFVVRLLSYASPMRWGLNGLFVLTLKGLDGKRDTLELYGYDAFDPPECAAVLAVILVVRLV